MSEFEFRLGGETLVSGPGSLSWLNKLKGKRASIFTTRFMIRNGTVDRIVEILRSKGFETELISEYQLNPSFSEALALGKDLQKFNPDWIIAIGGGTVMDLAKLAWVLYEHPALDELEKLRAAMDNLDMSRGSKFLCIPTTSGSASEVSKSSVITDDISGKKVPIRNLTMVPNLAILDPELTLSLPAALTAETGMDALAHNIESLVSPKATPISDAFAYHGSELIFKWLPEAYRNGENLEARENMLFSSTMGGLAFSSATLGLSHGIAHAIGAVLDVPHGLMNAILLPLVIRFNQKNPVAQHKYAQLAQRIGSEDLAQSVTDLREELNLPPRLMEVVEDETLFTSNFEMLLNESLKDGLTQMNCIIPNETQLARILNQAYFGA